MTSIKKNVYNKLKLNIYSSCLVNGFMYVDMGTFFEITSE